MHRQFWGLEAPPWMVAVLLFCFLGLQLYLQFQPLVVTSFKRTDTHRHLAPAWCYCSNSYTVLCWEQELFLLNRTSHHTQYNFFLPFPSQARYRMSSCCPSMK